MKVLIVCLVLIGVALSAPPPKKVEKGYELKEYHSSSKDNGYHGDSYGPKPHYDEGYGKKDYNKVEVCFESKITFDFQNLKLIF